MKEKELASLTSRSTRGTSTGFRIELAPRAIREADIARDWLEEKASPTIANAWYRELIVAIETLANFPERCPVADESDVFDEEVRQLLFGKKHGVYRILYAIKDDVVHVLSVRHCSQSRDR